MNVIVIKYHKILNNSYFTYIVICNYDTVVNMMGAAVADPLVSIIKINALRHILLTQQPEI